MITIKQIVDQDLVCANEGQKLIDLQNQYVKEQRKYSDKYYVQFYDNNNPKIGRIQRAKYRDGAIIYCILVVTKSGVYSNRDKSFYYKRENQIVPHVVLNAMHNQ